MKQGAVRTFCGSKLILWRPDDVALFRPGMSVRARRADGEDRPGVAIVAGVEPEMTTIYTHGNWNAAIPSLCPDDCLIPEPAPVTLGDIAKLLAQMQLLEIGRQFGFCSCGEVATVYSYGAPTCDGCGAKRPDADQSAAPCAKLVRRLRAIVEAS